MAFLESHWHLIRSGSQTPWIYIGRADETLCRLAIAQVFPNAAVADYWCMVWLLKIQIQVSGVYVGVCSGLKTRSCLRKYTANGKPCLWTLTITSVYISNCKDWRLRQIVMGYVIIAHVPSLASHFTVFAKWHLRTLWANSSAIKCGTHFEEAFW